MSGLQGVGPEVFGQVDGKDVLKFSLTNSKGMTVELCTYGAIIISLTAPDRAGKYEDVVLGYPTLQEYVNGSPYFGSVVGRYGNRIANGKFTLGGNTYQLEINNGNNHLHGGLKGFDKKVWDAEIVHSVHGQAVAMTCVSEDGEGGYPGRLTAKVTYTLTEESALHLDYVVTAEAETVANLTNHTYFNLGGPTCENCLGHLLTLNADAFTPVDAGSIPTGEIRSVAGTPMDFRTSTAIGARIEFDDEQLQFGIGYDHNFIVNGPAGSLRLAAEVSEPTSGRHMECWTTEPGVQFYSGNFLNGSFIAKGNNVASHRKAFCLETQHYPDSPNKPEFPSTVIRPGHPYTSTTIYKFRAF